jgi:uncharacterized protein (TIGR02611 family)
VALSPFFPTSLRTETHRERATYPAGVDMGWARRSVDHVRLLRERIRSRRVTHLVYRFVVGLLGVALTLGGLLLVPLPGPGWLIVLAGLAVLASEFEPARLLLSLLRRRLSAWTAWVARRGAAVRTGLALGTAACVLAACYGSAVALGVPTWVPESLVPPLPGLTRTDAPSP